MFPTPTLRTARLVLAPPLMHEGMDVRHYVKWLNDPKVVQYSEQRHFQHCKASQYDYLATFDGKNNQIWEIRRTGIPIGTITAHRNTANRVAHMGIMIGNAEVWGQHYGCEAWEVVSNWLFKDGVRKLEAGCMASNTGMIKVMEKTGFVYEGRQRHHFLLNGKPEDAVYYGKIKEAEVVPIGRNGGREGVLGPDGEDAQSV